MTRMSMQDLFKEEFKRYKKRSEATDLADVIDFWNTGRFTEQLVPLLSQSIHSADTAVTAARLGLRPTTQWKFFRVVSVPALHVVMKNSKLRIWHANLSWNIHMGVVVICNPFRDGCQHRWVRQCLVSYPCRPNVCNLDAHMERQGRGEIWPGELAAPTSSEKKQKLSKGDDLLYKLRWVTLGYHYDWNTKEYYSHHWSLFPNDLAELSRFLLEIAGFPLFSPEAAIVNYYHLDSTLSGHTDHSEKDLTAPLLSISFGQSAIFLVGGRSKQVWPQALLLHSGDVVIMAGESRLAYHGVPKILPPVPGAPVPSCLTVEALMEGAQEMQCLTLKGGRCICCVCGREWKSAGNSDDVRSSKEQGVRLPSDSQQRGDDTCAGEGVKSKLMQKEQQASLGLQHHGRGACIPGIDEKSMLPDYPGYEAKSEHKPADYKTGDYKTGDSCEQVHCSSCQEMIDCWPQFVAYLSVSRINVNIRQVVSEKYTL